MSDIAIQVDGVSKSFQLGEAEPYGMLRDSVINAVKAPYRWMKGLGAAIRKRDRESSRTLWALRDVGFEVRRGEVLGVIGGNGAGKSTLLKILSRITEPSEGEINIFGRVGSLLEVGTGFHPELTGRENVYMNGAILGMTRREINAKFDEIVAFAGVEKFIDTPVKRYSSGMGVRLGFAVAAHLEPEILIVDEVLAVGDAEFQTKCLAKMNSVATSGRTILFVSHNMAAVQALCSRAILLKQGAVACSGSVEDVTSQYLNTASSENGSNCSVYRSTNASSLIREVHLLDDQQEPTRHIRTGRDMIFDIHLGSKDSVEDLTIRITILTATGIRVCNCNSRVETNQLFDLHGKLTIRCVLPEQRLAPGPYTAAVHVFTHGEQLDVADPALMFDVSPSDLFGTGNLPGPHKAVYLPRTIWSSRS